MSSKPAWLWISVASALPFLLVWERIQSVRLGYDVESLHAKVQTQEDRNAYLRLELERLRSPQTIAQAARQRLRMAPPNPESIIILDGRRGSQAWIMPWFLGRLFFATREQH